MSESTRGDNSLQHWPAALQTVGSKASLLQSSLNIPHNEVLSDTCVATMGDRGAERDQVAFTRREVDELNTGVAETLNLLEMFSTPQSDTPGVKRTQVGA